MQTTDLMRPAKSREEAAMTLAAAGTMTGGAALKSIMRTADGMEVMKEAKNEKTATEAKVTLPRRRSALRHVLERQF